MFDASLIRRDRAVDWIGLIAKTIVLLVLGVFCHVSGATSQAAGPLPLDDSGWKAKASIKLEDRVYLLGENVDAKFGITNTQDEPLKLDVGSDYRGTPRPLRFKVAAFDQDGQRVADPYPVPFMDMGGVGTTTEVAPGQTHWLHVPLGRYCDFQQGGEYTLRVYHDLGWDGDYLDKLHHNEIPPADHLAPIGETRIQFAMPSDAQAREVVERMAAILREHPNESGVDFATLRRPVYLPHLKALLDDPAETIGAEVSKAISEIATPEATSILVELLDHRRPAMATTAYRALLARLPGSDASRPDWRTGWKDAKQLAKQSWNGEHREKMLEVAGKLIATGSYCAVNIAKADAAADGCFIFGAVGSFSDYPKLKRYCTHIWDTGPEGYAAAQEYARAAWSLIGEHAESAAVKPLEQLVGYRTNEPDPLMIAKLLSVREDFRPTGWDYELEQLIRDMSPHVRLAATEAVPDDVLSDKFNDDDLLHYIKINFNDHDWSKTYKNGPKPSYFPQLQIASLNLAARLGSASFVPSIERVLKESADQRVLAAARVALKACSS